MGNMYKLLMLRYGELGLKGKNKSQFINRLVYNIEYALKGMTVGQVTSTWGRIIVPVQQDMPAVVEKLQKVFGIYSMSPVICVEKDMAEIKKAAYTVLKDALPQGGCFKVESRRSDKTFPLISPDISRQVAGYIFDQPGAEMYEAEMYHPQNTVNVEVRDEAAYVYSQVIAGAKGLPVGSSGKAVLMLSGGIDSPVAGWMAMKRGVKIEAVHFHSFPFTSERAKEKVVDLCRLLSAYSNTPVRLHVVHFTEIQKAIYANCQEDYGITIMRRFMFRLAEKIAEENKALAIYTGECVGQVASQTLESMTVINQVTQMPVLRPLVGMDKEDIMDFAQRIGTYTTSIQPYEDCCTVFLPAHPKIRPHLSEAIEMEKALNVEELIAEALSKTQVLEIKA